MKNSAHDRLYRNDARQLLLIFDRRESKAVEALRWWPVVWCGEVDVEELEDHIVLALSPGGASRRAGI